MNDLVSVSGEFNNSQDLIKTGLWHYFDSKSGDTLKFGNYKHGHKHKMWTYFYGSGSYKIEWDTYNNSGFSVDYPSTWKTTDKEGFLFYSLKDSVYGYNVTHVGGKDENELETYLKDFLKRVNKFNVNDISFKKEILQDSIILYNGSFTYKNKKGISISCISSIFQKDNYIYDCTYFKRGSSNLEKKDFLIEKEMTTSIFIEDEQLFIVPYITKSTQLEINFN
ncbi:PsbP-related protein [Zunongwangia sp. H14]|uniref:PsbP-related protein n=1 Tax=Zunongwangia sp. H14 TaxID=3240792 RepID=UPI00356A182E